MFGGGKFGEVLPVPGNSARQDWVRVTLGWVGRWRKVRCRIALRRIRRRRVLWRVAVTWWRRGWRHRQLATVGGLSGYLIAALVHALHVGKIEPPLQNCRKRPANCRPRRRCQREALCQRPTP